MKKEEKNEVSEKRTDIQNFAKKMDTDAHY